MNRGIKYFLLFALALIIAACTNDSSNNVKKIGIIVPLQNQSLHEIVAGFKSELQAAQPGKFVIKVANAQGDMNLQRAIIQQFKDEHFDLVVPIGTQATEATLSMVRAIPLIGLATNFNPSDSKKMAAGRKNMVLVHDEIPPVKILSFIHAAFPKIKKLVLIHSGTEKIYPDVQTAIQNGKQFNIEVTPLMATTLNDLYVIGKTIPSDTQAILILKDILIASGITTLAHTANKLHVPLITADEGSVRDGAALALGVPEAKIGKVGANFVTALLSKQALQRSSVDIEDLTVFISQKHLQTEQVDDEHIKMAAKNHHYPVVNVDAHAT